MAGTVASQYTVEDDEEQKKPQFSIADEESPAAGKAASSGSDLDEYLKSGHAAGASAEPTEENLPGSTPRLRAAIKSGVAKMQPPTQFEKERTPEGSALYRGAKAFGSDVLGAVQGVGEALQGPIGLAGAPAQAAQMYLADQKRKEAGYSPLYRGAAALGSVAGVNPEGMEEAAAHGDTAGVVGHTVLPALGAVAGLDKELTGGKGMELAGEAAKLPVKVADKLIRGTPITEAGKIEAAVKQIMNVKPAGMNEIEYEQKVRNAVSDLHDVARQNAGKIENPRDARNAINERIKQLEAPISDHLSGLKGPGDMVHPDQYQKAISDKIDEALNRRAGNLNDTEKAAAKKKVMDWIGQDQKSYETLEGNRIRLNQDAEKYYKSDTGGKHAIDVSDATAVAQRAAGDAIRDVLYGAEDQPGVLEGAGVKVSDAQGNPVSLRDMRKRVGNLIEIRDHFEDAVTRAERNGDWSAFDSTRKGPSLAAGGLGALWGMMKGGGLGLVGGVLGGEVAKALGDYRSSKNANLNIQKAFSNLEKTAPENAAPALKVTTQPPIHQYDQPVGPQLPHSMEAAGPNLPPEPFELPGIQPKPQAGLWEQQAGALPDLTWGGKNPPYFEPAGPREAPMEAPLPPIQGTQQSLNLPPENAPLFNIQQTPRVGEPPAPVAPPPEGGALPPIGGPGREGVLEPISKGKPIGNQEPLTTSHGVTFGGGQDLGKGLGIEHTISVGGRRVGSITVEPRDEGVLHVHWLGGEFGREMRQPIMDAIQEAYPETKRITYDRRRLARGAESATTEPREMNIKPMVPPKS